MDSVICPCCGSKIVIPDSMPANITCKRCKSCFGVEYEEIEPLTIKEKVKKFIRDHKEHIVLAAIIVAGAIFKGYSAYQALKEETLPDDADACNSDIPADSSSSSNMVSSEPSVEYDPDDYDWKLRQHDLSIRNMDENHYPSMEKRRQADELRIPLGTHQTIVNSYSQHHRVKKQDS